MLPAAFDVDRAQADVHWLVEELGPRPAGSPVESAATEGVAARLEAAGWTPREAGSGAPGLSQWTSVVACRGEAKTLFLAHLDSVPESPGAGDNAAAVAVLLELARTTSAEDLCLGFPVAEEVGLQGSRSMARALDEPSERWLEEHQSLDLVVALDLVGWAQEAPGGPAELAANGLGPAWSSAELAWLRERADSVGVPLSLPYAYRTMSHAAPWMERSDHAPFAAAGIRSLHLMHRGPHGVFPDYHQPTDTEVDPRALEEVASVLEALASAPDRPAPGASAGSGASAVVFGLLLPDRFPALVVAAGVLSGALELRRLRELPGMLWRGLLCVIAASLAMAAVSTTGLLGSSTEELTAQAVMGMPATGWWAGATWATLLGAAAFFGLRWRLRPTGSAPLAAALLGLLALQLDVLVAMPLALGGLLGRVHPLLCLLGPLYLLRPDGLRELSFHGLMGPELWGLLWLLALPCIGSYGGSPAGTPGAARTPKSTPEETT